MYKNFIYNLIKSDIIQGKYKIINTRFAPEPNGYLHIGHAKSIYLNFGIAEYFNGNCNLRFDDTNPDEENNVYVESIINDIQWLGYKINKQNIHFASDYFDIFYEYAKELIIKGLAYVDELSPQLLKEFRGSFTKQGTDSPFRNRSVKENLYFLEKMKNAEYEEGQACLRAKINMKDSIILYRDPILYRIKYITHYRTLNKWCIYPTYDFAHCISDAIEKITHSLCTLEFVNNKILYNWILKNISIGHKPNQYEFSRLNLEYNLMSKRKIKKLINQKIVTNWDDPRMITISGLKNRGYDPETIKEFCIKIGITRQENLISISFLENLLRKKLDNICKRYFAVLQPVKVLILNLHKNFKQTIVVPNHPKKTNMGNRKISLTYLLYIDKIDVINKIKKYACPSNKHNHFIIRKNLYLRLRYANCLLQILELICKHDEPILIIGKILYKYDLLQQKHPIIHWLSCKEVIKTIFIVYNHLFNIINPENNNNYLNYINPNSKIIKFGFIEKNIKKKTLKYLNEIYQFERIGYFRCVNYYEYNLLKFIQIIPLKKNY